MFHGNPPGPCEVRKLWQSHNRPVPVPVPVPGPVPVPAGTGTGTRYRWVHRPRIGSVRTRDAPRASTPAPRLGDDTSTTLRHLHASRRGAKNQSPLLTLFTHICMCTWLFCTQTLHRAREGSRHASAFHAMRRACATRTGDRSRSVPVRVEDLVQNDGAAEEWRAPSLTLAGQLGQLVCGKDVQRARRRSLCSRCSPLVSEPRMPVSSHAPGHVMVMLTWARACAFADVR